MSGDGVGSGRPLRVAILGAGAAGLAAYVLLDRLGHQASVFSPSGASTRLFLEGVELNVTGVLEGRVLPRVARTLEEAVDGADAVLVAMPANGQKACLDSLAPLLRPHQAVLMSAHASFAALYLNRLLARRGASALVVTWARTITRSRRPEPGLLRIATQRGTDMACLPASRLAEGVELCRTLFGALFVPRETLLQTSLSNMNPHSHLALALTNITRMERGEDWAQHECQTPAVCRMLEALDAERTDIATAFGLEVPTTQQNHARALGTDAPLPVLTRMLFEREVSNGLVTKGPQTLESRYVLEDMPFGVATTLMLSRMTGRSARLHEAGLTLMSALYGRDFAAENDLLPVLDLEGLSPGGFAELCIHGYGSVFPA